jgi:hypothetical protein
MNMTKLRIALPAVAGLLIAAGMSSAAKADLLQFGINPGTLGGVNQTFTADALNWNTAATVTQNAGGTQTEVGWATLTNASLGGVTALSFGPGTNQGIYVQYTANVNLNSFTPGSLGQVTSFTFSVFGDIGNNDTFHGASTTTPGAGTVTVNPPADVLLATGVLVPGANNTAGFNSQGGPSFSVLSTFNLTAAGAGVFTNPSPFYTLVFNSSTSSQGGNVVLPTALNGLAANQVAISSVINSSFLIPEPSSLLLFGSALMGLGAFVMRRRKSANLS